MRLDLFLKKVCIVRQRSVAKEICDAGAVLLNGHQAKPGQDVEPGDLLQIHYARRELELRVLEVPRGNIVKREVFRYIEVLRDDVIDPLS